MRIFSGAAVALELGDAINNIEEAALRLPSGSKANAALQVGLAKLKNLETKLIDIQEN